MNLILLFVLLPVEEARAQARSFSRYSISTDIYVFYAMSCMYVNVH